MIHAQRFRADRRVILEREEHDHDDRRHVNDEQHVRVNMREHIRRGVGDFLLDQLRLRLADGEVMTLALIAGEHRQQDDGKHRKNDRQQRCARLRKRLVRNRRARQPDDFRIDRVVTEQRRRAHRAQAGDERHDRQRKKRRDQRRENDLEQHLKGLCAHVARGFDGVIVDAADGVAKEERVIARAGERHCEKHRAEAGEPVLVHVGERLYEPRCEDAVAVVKEEIAGHQRHAGIDQRGHIAQTQHLRAFDIEVLG